MDCGYELHGVGLSGGAPFMPAGGTAEATFAIQRFVHRRSWS